jgi:hypothetical protein
VGASQKQPGRLDDLMGAPPVSLTQEVLADLVERVTYHNAENGFCVLRAKARGHRDIVTVVGHAAIVSAGATQRVAASSVQPKSRAACM